MDDGEDEADDRAAREVIATASTLFLTLKKVR